MITGNIDRQPCPSTMLQDKLKKMVVLHSCLALFCAAKSCSRNAVPPFFQRSQSDLQNYRDRSAKEGVVLAEIALQKKR